MKRVCLDTHTLIWHLSSPKKLGKAASRLLRAADSGRALALIPAIALIELSLLRDANRDVIGPAEVEAMLAVNNSFQLLPLDLQQSLEFALLVGISDPFDRLVVSAARSANATLLTADSSLQEKGFVPTAWD